jgi:hypothetical protein
MPIVYGRQGRVVAAKGQGPGGCPHALLGDIFLQQVHGAKLHPGEASSSSSCMLTPCGCGSAMGWCCSQKLLWVTRCVWHVRLAAAKLLLAPLLVAEQDAPGACCWSLALYANLALSAMDWCCHQGLCVLRQVVWLMWLAAANVLLVPLGPQAEQDAPGAAAGPWPYMFKLLYLD